MYSSLFGQCAYVGDDVIDFLIAKISETCGITKAKHACIGSTMFDGFADKAIGGLIKKSCFTNGGTSAASGITITVDTVTG